MFSPATVHVLPFDPSHGADQARQYAGTYASKPEKWYYLETERDGVKDFFEVPHGRPVHGTQPVAELPRCAFNPPCSIYAHIVSATEGSEDAS